MPILTKAEYVVGDIRVRYLASADKPDGWGFAILPEKTLGLATAAREYLDSPAILNLPDPWRKTLAWEIDPLVHAHVAGEAYAGGYAQGRSLRNSATTQNLAVTQQRQNELSGSLNAGIRTTLKAGSGLIFHHEVLGTTGGLEVRTSVENPTERPITLDFLSAFSLGGITPFAAGDEPGRIRVHRFRSAWSAEGRHEVISAEALNLERSWTGHGGRIERFGQVGSLPVNGWFPLVALEDARARVVWLAQLATPGTWQLEVSRRSDTFALSGGGADRLDGEWRRTLAPGETFCAPTAFVTTVAGTIDDACDRLIAWQRGCANARPESEQELPVIFNEWCTSWGHPDHASLVRLADRLAGSGVRYLVIDDGWAERPSDAFQQNGDWKVNRRAFPDGLRATADAIRARGLIPGIWFEFEAVNPGSAAWNETAHHLHRDGVPLQVGSRRFWDFRDPWVHDYLGQRVVGLLREGGFGYLKVDCNDSIGPGVDGAESPGENLRLHLEGVQQFFARLSAEVPGLVIENCASGGHRLEPSMIALTAMSSFSDAHETTDLPIIAANSNRLVWSAQKQIWAVLRASDSRQRLCYSLAATFLGRMCLSGDIEALPEAEWRWVNEAIAFYREVAPIIRDGVFRTVREGGESYQHPTGYQVVTVQDIASESLLVIWHRFAAGPDSIQITLPDARLWVVERTVSASSTHVEIRGQQLRWVTTADWSGGVFWLREVSRAKATRSGWTPSACRTS